MVLGVQRFVYDQSDQEDNSLVGARLLAAVP